MGQILHGFLGADDEQTAESALSDMLFGVPATEYSSTGAVNAKRDVPSMYRNVNINLPRPLQPSIPGVVEDEWGGPAVHYAGDRGFLGDGAVLMH